MSSINVVSSSPAATAATTAGGGSSAGSTQKQESDFLKLLVTQMQNQDPMNPMSNAEVTTQIAQLNTVQGISDLNTTLTGMAASTTATQSIQAAGLVGHNVLAPGSNISLRGGSAIFGVSLAQPVDALNVTITDASGKVIDTMKMGSQSAGTLQLNWDGTNSNGAKVADGAYTFSVSAVSKGAAAAATALSVNQVTSVLPSSAGVMLNLSGAAAAALSDVAQIM